MEDRQDKAAERRALFVRRTIFAVLTVFTGVSLIVLMSLALLPGGFSVADFAMVTLFAITLPWTVIGFWNAVIGLWLMRTSKDPAIRVFPALAKVDEALPLSSSTALLSCIRNEDVDRIETNLVQIVAELTQKGVADHFHLYVLSDTDDPEIILEEEGMIASLQDRIGARMALTYRRREKNTAFKSGNIRDFLDRWGEQHDFMVTLDADSFMTAPAILRLVRLMGQRPELGIVQSLVVGLPSASAFTRVFQFGMRLGMRSYTTGSAWWQGDCGPYWGHNAIIRVAPFSVHCRLPTLSGPSPLSGCVLSHDQVEATLMRRAGYEVRVIAEDGGSYEENPPHLLEFMRRDLRWCHGNMQYFKLLGEPGLKPISRMQLVLAILMFIGSPAWLAFMSLATYRFMFETSAGAIIRPELGVALFAIIMTMIFAPKIATVVDTLFDRNKSRAYGGRLSVMASAFGELLFSALIAPVMAIAHTVFLAGLPFGRAKAWPAQRRDVHGVPFRMAFPRLSFQLIFGLLGLAAALMVPLGAALALVPVFLGPLIAIGFAMITATPGMGQVAARSGLWRLPEETVPTASLEAIRLPAYQAMGSVGSAPTGNGSIVEDQRILPAE